MCGVFSIEREIPLLPPAVQGDFNHDIMAEGGGVPLPGLSMPNTHHPSLAPLS